MKTYLSLLLLLLATRLVVQAQEPVETPLPPVMPNEAPVLVPVPVVTAPTFMDAYIHDRLEIGTRFTSHDLDQTKKGDRETRIGTYFGTINEMKVEDESAPTKFYIQYRLHDYVGLGIALDEYGLETRDGPTSDSTDGTVNVDSTYFYIFGRYPLPHGFVPFIEFGYATHSVDFSPKPDWARRGNGLNLGDESSTFYSLGLEYHITAQFSVNVLMRWTSYDISGEYTVNDGRSPLPVTIKADQSVTGFGLKYTF